MNIIDKTIAIFSPRRALARARYRAALRVYEGAQVGRRASSWKGRGASANAEISQGLKLLRDRSRELVRNTPHAPRLLDILANNIVGEGIRPQSSTGSPGVDSKVDVLFDEWQKRADVQGIESFYGLQVLALKAMVEGGESVVRFIDRKLKDIGEGARVPLQLQLLEGDYIDEARDGAFATYGANIGAKRSRLGVGLGEYDKHMGLWLWPEHPGELIVTPKTILMSAFVKGEELIHLFLRSRPGQVRGVSWFSPMMQTARDHADFMDAVHVKARAEACFTAFVTQDDFEGVLEASANSQDLQSVDNPNAMTTTLEPGMVKTLRPGQDIKFAQPTSTSQVEAVMMFALMAMAASVGVTYHQVSGDLRQANYSSLRAGGLEFQRMCSQFQQLIFIPRFCQRVWDQFVSRAIIAGELGNRKGGYPCEWTTPKWESVNPKLDLTAEENCVRAGRMTPQEYYAQWGGNWQKNLRDIQKFYKLADELGVEVDIDCRKFTRAGLKQAVQPGQAAPGVPGGAPGPNGADGGGKPANGTAAPAAVAQVVLVDANGEPIDLSDLESLDGGEGRELEISGFPFRVRITKSPVDSREFDENQPRDPDGKWSGSGGSEGSGGKAAGGKAGSSATAAKSSKADGPGQGTSESHGTVSGAYEGRSPGNAGSERTVNGATVSKIYEADATARTGIEDRGGTPIAFSELEAGATSAQVFHDYIKEAHDANKWGVAVAVYDAKDYESKRLFVTADGKHGFALDGNNIVSVFKHPDATTKQCVTSILKLAVQEGGQRLDCFDTQLPIIYGVNSFRAVARLAFDPQYQPEGWDKEVFKKFNDGQPDVVFMVFDKAGVDLYKRGDGATVLTYEEGEKTQADELAKTRALVRDFDESQHPRDPDGKFTDGGGGSGGGGSTPKSSASAPKAKAPATPKVEAPKAETQAAPAATISEKSGEKKKTKLDDFVKAKINLGVVASQQEKFVEDWDAKVGMAPDEFKSKFLGGVDATMTINPNSSGRWLVGGELKGPAGQTIGQYNRTIDIPNKTAESDYFKLYAGHTGGNVGKIILAGNMEVYKKLGIEKVKVHANIDVGGYAWAKYGYVPTRSSWGDLSSLIERKIEGGSGGGGSGYKPESWDEIGSDQQDHIYERWRESTSDEFLQSEIERWREGGQPLHEAKTTLAEDYSSTKGGEWFSDAIASARFAHGGEIPYTDIQLGEAITIDYSSRHEDGSDDPEISFDDSKLGEPSTLDKDQMALPGIPQVDASKALTDDMRVGIEAALIAGFNREAEKNADDMEPPDYLSENISDYQGEVWESMSDREKYRWADNNGHIEEVPNEDDDAEPVDVGAEAGTLLDLARESDPKALWAIADSPQGKELLLGTDWYGEINLKDKETMDRFDKYVGKVK